MWACQLIHNIISAEMMAENVTTAIPDGGLQPNQPVVQRRNKPGRQRRAGLNGLCLKLNRPKSEFFSPSGISTLDIRTRLRITEAELAIVQREVSDLLTERNTLETSTRLHEESWKFAVQECGRIVEQRDELQRRVEKLELATIAAAQFQQVADGNKSKKGKVSKQDLDQCKLALETQTRVCETLEHERDRANDDYEFIQAQLHTLMQQYQELSSACSEVARERAKAKAQVDLLREELHRYEPDTDTFAAREAKKSNDSLQSGDNDINSTDGGSESEQTPAQQVKELREEKNALQSAYEQAAITAEQYQKQLYRAEEDRRQALATSEALTSLWQKKFEKAQNENYELKQELLSAHERISHLQDRLAMERLHTRPLNPRSPKSGSLDAESFTSVIGGPPQRTSSFHSSLSQGTGYSTSLIHSSSLSQSSTIPNIAGVKKMNMGRRGSLNTTQELISPSNTSFYHSQPATLQTTPSSSSRRLFHFADIHESGSHSTDSEDGSWI